MWILQGKMAESYVRSLEQRGSRVEQIEPKVRRIVGDVRRGGDKALMKYARKFGDLRPAEALRVTDAEMRAAWKRVGDKLKNALRHAERNIRQFCEWQKPESWNRCSDGIMVGQMVRPLESVGCYVPGGRFPLVSTLLMTTIPAQVAGVENIRVFSPRAGVEILAAAEMLGIREVYRVGGAQAIAAMAYGTETVSRVDKIVGPGNSYVTAAKKLVALDCAIDMLAGPTEALIVSDSGNPEFIAADLRAQSEHDPETLAVFITTSKPLADAVARSMNGGPREVHGPRSGDGRHAVLVACSQAEAFVWANRIAPEHITIEKRALPLVRNAGSIFIGDYSAQAAGDYLSGPNHVLPTAGAARFRGGLSVMDFVKLITVQELSAKGLQRLAPAIVSLAEGEGLRAHAESVRVRCANA